MQPQVGIPDVIIWILKGSKRKRKAYARISPNDVLFSERPGCSGRLCGQATNIYFKVPLHAHTLSTRTVWNSTGYAN